MKPFISAAIKVTNYFPLHRTGCTLKRDSFVSKVKNWDNRLYGPAEYFIQDIILCCDWANLPETQASYQLFLVNEEIDYNSYYSLN